MSDLGAILEADLQAIGLEPGGGPPDFVPRVLQFAALLAKWNPAIRLVGPDDPKAIVREQIVDALGFALALHAVDDDAFWDVGAGGGLPGIPLALRYPERRFVMIEPIHKKTAFLREAARALKLDNVVVHTGRVEADGTISPPLDLDWRLPKAALSRATLAPEVWLETGRAMVGPAGLVLVACAEQVPSIVVHDPRSTPIGVWRWRVPATNAPRTLIARRFMRFSG